MKVENDILHEAATRSLNAEEYSDLFIVLSNTSPNVLSDSISPSDVIKIISLLDFEIDISDQLVRLLLPLLPAEFVLESSDLLISCLEPNNPQLSVLILNELQKLITNMNRHAEMVTLSATVMEFAIKLMYNDDSEVSAAALKFLRTYSAQSSEICAEVFGKNVISSMANISGNSLNVLRYLELATDVALQVVDQSVETARLVLCDVYVSRLRATIDSADDVLTRLNGLHLAKRLTAHFGPSSVLAAVVLHDSGIMDAIYKLMFDSVDDNLVAATVIPECLAVFGSLMNVDPRRVLEQYSRFMLLLQKQVLDSDLVVCLRAIEVVAAAAARPDSKLLLQQHYDGVMLTIVAKVGSLLKSSVTAYRLRACHALAHIVSVPIDAPHFEQLSQTSDKWWHAAASHCGGNVVAVAVTGFIQVPAEDSRAAGLGLALALSTQVWGQRALLVDRTLTARLLQRDDGWHSCIELKFELISNLVQVGIRAGHTTPLCDPTTALDLETYFQQGKYYGVHVAEEFMIDTDV